jgi:hypothetical protein
MSLPIRRAPWLLPALLLATAAAAWQDDTPTVPVPADAATAVQAPAGDPAGDDPQAPPLLPADLSPDDYQASEQISEDLSVSFPVDI